MEENLFDFDIGVVFDKLIEDNSKKQQKKKEKAVGKKDVKSSKETEDKKIKEEKPKEVEEKQKKPSKKSEKKELEKDEIIKEMTKDLKAMKKELLQKEEKIKELLSGQALIVDLSNNDNSKNIFQLMDEGKVLKNGAGREFILAKQNVKPYASVSPPVHRIFCDEIKGIIVRRYFEDLTIVELGNRTLIREVVWCKHNENELPSVITMENLYYLLDNGLINPKIVSYTFTDLATYESFTYNKDVEPSLADIKKEIAKSEAIYAENNKYNLGSSEDEVGVK